MKVFQIQDDWTMDHLKIAERDQPEPGPGEVLLQVKAASLNYRDLVVPLRGYGSFTGTLPLVPVSDGVGQVVEIGAGVTRVAPSDRVCPMFMQKWIAGEPDLVRITSTLGGPIDGVMQEYMVVNEEGLAQVPEVARRLMEQIKLAAQLQNPNITRILGIGKVESSYYISYEYLEGKNLKAVLRRCRRGVTDRLTLPGWRLSY